MLLLYHSRFTNTNNVLFTFLYCVYNNSEYLVILSVAYCGFRIVFSLL